MRHRAAAPYIFRLARNQSGLKAISFAPALDEEIQAIREQKEKDRWSQKRNPFCLRPSHVK
jgi:hypothetical protein